MFGIVQAPANATLDQTKLFAPEINRRLPVVPGDEGTFQITFPTGGFGGMVTKPWSERDKTTEQLQVEASAGARKIAGVRVIPLVPPALPGGGELPGGLRDRLDRRAAAARRSSPMSSSARRSQSGLFIFADSDLKFDQPQAEVVFDRDKLRSAGVDLAPGRPGPLDAPGRQLRQPLQHPGAQLQGDPAGQAQPSA